MIFLFIYLETISLRRKHPLPNINPIEEYFKDVSFAFRYFLKIYFSLDNLLISTTAVFCFFDFVSLHFKMEIIRIKKPANKIKKIKRIFVETTLR